MPCGGFVHADGFENVDGRARQQEIGGAARLVVITAGAVGFGEVEIGREPVGGRVRVSQRLAVIIKERLVPGEAVIAEGREAEDEEREKKDDEGDVFCN